MTPEMIARFQRHLFYYRQHSGEPLSVSSQSHWLTSLRGWFSWMKDEKLIEHPPTSEMRRRARRSVCPGMRSVSRKWRPCLAQAETTPAACARARRRRSMTTGMLSN